jgi:hypothetical protein
MAASNSTPIYTSLTDVTPTRVNVPSTDELQKQFATALAERNRLSHSFYRQHNFRRNSNEGRELMLKDLEGIHDTLLNAYKAVCLLTGVDLEAEAARFDPLTAPRRHLPI